MIKPKHSFGKKAFEVNEGFIDREEAKSLYHNKLNNNDRDYNVLVFYGVGGIGKSKLRKELCRMHEEENKEGITFYLDLNPADDRNLGQGILKLVDSCSAKIDFKCFEMAYALYFRKKNPSASYGREKDMVTENTFVGIGLNIIGILDNGITSTAAEIVERTIRAVANRTIDKDVKETLKHFDDYSIAEMEERLPLFFQYDLMCYTQKHSEAKILIVFDTFEALNENVIEQIHRSKNERWIQDIISYFDRESFPKLLVTIFGRDEIEWDEEWQGLLDQYQLTEFETEYSKQYLERAGIEDAEIATAIIESSKGYPFLLYLSLETYANMKNSGKEPLWTDFGGSYPEIIERFLYNLDKDTVEVLRLMSVPNFYNDQIFGMMIKEFNVSFPMTEYEQFNKYSFVTFDELEGDYYIHDLMRRGIIDKTPESAQNRAHKCLLNYYDERITESVSNKNVFELFYHAKKSFDILGFNSWLKNPLKAGITPIEGLKKLQERGEQNVLIQLINGILADFELKDLLIDLVNIYIDIVHLGGDYDIAVNTCGHYLEQYEEETIMADEQLIKMRIRKIHHSMFYMPVDALIQDAEHIIDNVNIRRFPEQYNELLFLLGGNLGVLSGNFDYCNEWLEMSMAYAKKHKMDSFIHRTARKQADLMLARNNLDGALSLINNTITVDTPIEEVNTRYKIYLMGVLGEVYRKMGGLDSAYHCFDIMDKKASENHMPGWQAHALLAKGMVELLSGKNIEAYDHFTEALYIYKRIKQAWGIINTETALFLCNLKNGIELIESSVQECLREAERMNYRYNANYLKKLLVGETPYLQLFFL